MALFEGEPLPGSRTSVENAAKAADVILSGKVIKSVAWPTLAAGRITYTCTVHVENTSKGKATGDVQLLTRVQVIPAGEGPPRAGTRYVFYAAKVGDRFETIKVDHFVTID